MVVKVVAGISVVLVGVFTETDVLEIESLANFSARYWPAVPLTV